MLFSPFLSYLCFLLPVWRYLLLTGKKKKKTKEKEADGWNTAKGMHVLSCHAIIHIPRVSHLVTAGVADE